MEPRKNAVECQLPTSLPVRSAIAEKARFPPDLRALRKKSERLTGSALGLGAVIRRAVYERHASAACDSMQSGRSTANQSGAFSFSAKAIIILEFSWRCHQNILG